MKIRTKVLWQIPVYCALGGLLSFMLTVYLGGFIFGTQTVRPDGAIELSVNPFRSAIFNLALFVGILMIGGFWFRRSMTRKEIAVSAVIASLFYLAIVLAQICIPDFPLSASITLAYFQNWTGEVASLLFRVTHNTNLSAILSCFCPMLFVLFGK